MFAGINLGIGFLVAGLVTFILVWVFLRLFPRNLQLWQEQQRLLKLPDASESGDAIIVIQSGGRVQQMNHAARKLFGLGESDNANLERLKQLAHPANDFLTLCVKEGQKRITIGTQLTEATSYRIPGLYPVTILTLSPLDLTSAISAESGESSFAALRTITDFAQAITRTLNIDVTLEAIFENVERLIPADLFEIKIWDEQSQTLIPYRFILGSDQTRLLLRSKFSLFEDFTTSLIESKEPICIPETPDNYQEPQNNGTTGESLQISIKSYVGIPLLVHEQFVGTIELGQVNTGKFSHNDVELLNLVAGQIAVALHNAILYETEQRRTLELTGLANLAQAIGVGQEMKDLFERLVKSIAPLFEVEIVGFLLHDEEKRTLEGQIPFQGLPAHIVEMYRTTVSAEQLTGDFLRPKPIVTLDAAKDENWDKLDLQTLAQAASLRDSALVPLLSGRKLVGFLQLSNHREGVVPFSEKEIHLMQIVAEQATAVIENSFLVQQSQERAFRSDALRRIASLSASSVSLDEKIEFSLRELSHLFHVDMAAIYLLDEARGELVLHTNSLFGVDNEQVIAELSRISVSDAQFRLSVTGSKRSFISGRVSVDRRLLPIYRPLVTTLQVESALVVPLLSRGRSLGELMLGSQKPNFFNTYDIQIVTTASGQIAAAIETSHLVSQSDEKLRNQVEHLTALSRVSKQLHNSLSVDDLLKVIHTESQQLTGADCCTLVLFDVSNNGQAEHQIKHAIGCKPDKKFISLLNLIESGSPLVINDFEKEKIEKPHRGVRSALLVPVEYQRNLLGVMYLHADTPGVFDESLVDLMQTMVAQASIALNTVNQYQLEIDHAEQLRQRANSLSQITDISHSISLNQSLEQLLNTIATGIQEATKFKMVLISVYEPETGLLRRVTGVGLPPDTLNELLARKQPLASIKALLKPEFRLGNSYFIPAKETPVVSADVHIVTLELDEVDAIGNVWDPKDMFLMMLEDEEGNPLGLISLDAPSNGLRPDESVVEIMDAFAAQAALAINNHTRVSALRDQVDTLSAGLQRQQRLVSVSQNDLSLLLHKDLEQTIAIHNLDRKAQRVRAGLAITESVSRQLEASSALLALGREVLTQLGMSVALIAEEHVDGPRLLHVLGSVPRATSPETLFGQRNPLRTCLQSGETILVANVDVNDEWRDTPLLNGLRAKAFICLPITVEKKVVAAIMAASHEPMPPLTEEDHQVYFQIARQTSMILQNISLLSETRRRLREVNLLLDFSRQISGLKRDEIVVALLQSARRVIQAAHAGVVLLWNENTKRLEPINASGYADNESLSKISYRSGEALPGMVFNEKAPRCVDEIDFPTDYALTAENLMLFRKATGGRLPVSSLLIPIVSGEHGLGVLVLDNFNTQAAFSPDDEALLLSLSQQVALSLENVRLVHATQERAVQLQALTEASTSITANLMSDELISSLLDQLNAILPYDTATLLLRDEKRLKVAAARGFDDSEQRIGLTVAVEDSALFKEMAESGQSILVGDMRKDERFLVVESPRLSWLGIPLFSKNELVGVIMLEKWQPHFYSQENAQIAMTFAGQAAISLENARLYEESVSRAVELDQRSQRLALLNLFSSQMSGLLNTDKILGVTTKELHSTLYALETFAVYFENNKPVLKTAIPDKEPEILPDCKLFERLQESLGVFSTENVKDEPDLEPLQALLGTEPRALLVVPLVSGTTLHGLIFLLAEKGRRYSPAERELALTFVNQASIALESARLYDEAQRHAQETSALAEVGREISATLDLEAVLHRIATHAHILLDGVTSAVYIPTPGDPDTLKAIAVIGEDVEEIMASSPVLNEGILGSIGLQKVGEIVNYARNDPRAILIEGTDYIEVEHIVGVPILLMDQLSGLMVVWREGEGKEFAQSELDFLTNLSQQAAIAIENAHLYQSTAQTAERLAILNEASYQVGVSLDPEEIYKAIRHSAEQLMPVDTFVISLLDEEAGEVEAVYLVDGDTRVPSMRIKLGEGLSSQVIQTGEPVLIHTHGDAKKAGGVTFGEKGVPHSILAVPMKLGDRELGMLSAQSFMEGVYDEADQQILGTLANQAIVAIQNGRHFAETQRLTQELEQRVVERTAELESEKANTETLLRILTEVSASLDLDRALGRTLALLNEAVGAEQGTIMLLHAEDNSLHYRAGYGYLSELASSAGNSFKLKVGEGLAGWSVKARDTALIEDLHKDERWVRAPSTANDHRSSIVTPLMVGEDAIGVLMVFHREVGFFESERLGMVKAIASQVAIAINNAHLYELIRDQAERLGTMLRKELEEASRSHAILESVADGVVVTDPENQVTFMNSSAEEILGISVGEITDNSLSLFDNIFDRENSHWMQTIREWSTDLDAFEPGDTYAEQLELENGRVALVHLAPVNFQNDFLGTVSIFRDITHEVEVDRLKSEFVATVSHELRTPMTSIRGYVDVLLMGAAGAMNDNQEQFLKVVKSNTERLNILVNDLLDVSRIESGQIKLSPQALDLRDLTEDILADSLRRSQEENKPIAFSMDSPKTLPRVYGDVERIRQVIGNLVENAYRYTPENGQVIIHLHAVNNSEVQVDVQDTGVGIDEKNQDKIFDRFYRGEDPLVLAAPGTGLGLSIVKQLVEMHHGKIWMESEGEGKGSTFSFTLPTYNNDNKD
jgi:PAS domain S-box-containing protein